MFIVKRLTEFEFVNKINNITFLFIMCETYCRLQLLYHLK